MSIDSARDSDNLYPPLTLDGEEERRPTRLYGLEPVDVGTTDGEGLRGYTMRLAEQHSVSVRHLLLHEIGPVVEGHVTLKHRTGERLSGFFAVSAAGIDGGRGCAAAFVDALHTLTLRDRNLLRCMTMLPWAEAISGHGLLRHKRAWCPDCYRVWAEDGRTVREPLLWSIAVVVVCPTHGRVLETRCPSCGHEQTPLSTRCRTGFCGSCHRWLGLATESAPGEGSQFAEVTPGQHGWNLWVAREIGRLIAAAPTLTLEPTRASLVAHVRAHTAAQAKGSHDALTVPSNEHALESWLRHARLISLSTLLRVSRRLDTTPLHLLTADVGEGDRGDAGDSDAMEVRVPERRHPPRILLTLDERERIKEILEQTLAMEGTSPPSLASVAKQAGYNRTTTRWYFPELSIAISRRYREYTRQRGEARIQKLVSEVRDVTRQIGEAGVYPSKNKVMPHLSNSHGFRNPVVRTVWLETMRELGWH